MMGKRIAPLREGIGRAILSVGYRHEAIRSPFGARHGDLELDYAVEDRPLGTGGASIRSLDVRSALWIRCSISRMLAR